MSELADLSARAWDNKIAKGFNTTDIPMEFCLLTAEVSEAFEAWRIGGDIAAELADVLLFTLSLARMLHIDLGEAANRKVTVNEQRTYRQVANGHVRNPV